MIIKKGALFAGILLFLITLASGSYLDVEKIDKGSVVISEFGNPAVFEFIIRNSNGQDNFALYNLMGIPMSPIGNFDIHSGKSNLTVKVFPNKNVLKYDGFYNFEYQLRGVNTGIFKDTLALKIVDLKDALEIRVNGLLPGEKTAIISVSNLENTNLEDLRIKFKSEFFDSYGNASLGPFESKNLTANVNLEKARMLKAGLYVIDAVVESSNAKVEVDGSLNYLEKEGISVKEDSSGILIRNRKIIKTNEGNVNANAKIQIDKDIVSRLFTVYSIEPSEIKRHGLYVSYYWQETLSPGKSLEVATTTNYTFPFILIVLVVVVAFVVKIYYRTNVVLTKRVSFVKTQGEQSAFKVTLRVRAKKSASNLQIIDRIPSGLHIYDKFGVKPDKVDPSSRRLIWHIQRLNAGEERVFSYIIYSKLKVIGKLELPSATAIFESANKSHEVFSNKTFFMNEALSKIED